MNSVYSGQVNYFGKELSADEVLKDKRRFADRWPSRQYAIRDGSLSVECAVILCRVNAIIDWQVRSEKRKKVASGASRASFLLDTDRNTILRESGSVIRPEGSDVKDLLAQWYKENGQCRGGLGDDPRTSRACDRRTVLDGELAKAGWCYGHQGEYGYQMKWHICDAASLR